MKPKGIRKPGLASPLKPSMGYSGIAVDMLSKVSYDKNSITETVEMNAALMNPEQTITEGVGVVIT